MNDLMKFCKMFYCFENNEYEYQWEFKPVEVSDLEVYDFLSQLTNSFDSQRFKYVINDIRNLVNKILFAYPIKVELDTDGFPKYEYERGEMFAPYPPEEGGTYYIQYNIKTLKNNSYILDCVFDDDKETPIFPVFEEQQTLSERIDLIKKHFPLAKFTRSYSELLRFSIIAEKEYKRVCEIVEKTETGLTKRQRLALLEHYGLNEYILNTTFKGNISATARFLSNIFSSNEQDIRKEIGKGTHLLLEDKKIKNVIEPIISEISKE